VEHSAIQESVLRNCKKLPASGLRSHRALVSSAKVARFQGRWPRLAAGAIVGLEKRLSATRRPEKERIVVLTQNGEKPWLACFVLKASSEMWIQRDIALGSRPKTDQDCTSSIGPRELNRALLALDCAAPGVFTPEHHRSPLITCPACGLHFP